MLEADSLHSSSAAQSCSEEAVSVGCDAAVHATGHVQVESKIDSAGLALWADIEQPPGSLPPDCVNFLQQALTKDPRQRPTAEQLQSHPWLAR